MTAEADRMTINVGLRRDLIAEIDRLATLADEFRYQTMERLLEKGGNLEKKEKGLA